MKHLIKNHGAHIYIISQNRPELLKPTIISIRDIFCKIRNVSLVVNTIFDKNQYNEIPYNINKICIRADNNKSSLLNNLFYKLREQGIHRIVIFWEGEMVIGSVDNIGWSDSIASFLKINTNVGFYWQIREYNLDYNWYFTDPYGEVPTLDINSKKGLSVSRIRGDYVIIDLTNHIWDNHNPG